MSGIALGLTLALGVIAHQTGIPEIAIDDTEAKAITRACAKLAQHYDLSVSGTAGAWMALAGTVGPIVGAHYLAYRARVAASTGQIPGLQGHSGARPPSAHAVSGLPRAA